MKGATTVPKRFSEDDLRYSGSDKFPIYHDFVLKIYRDFFCCGDSQYDNFIEQSLQKICLTFHFERSHFFVFTQNFTRIKCEYSFPKKQYLGSAGGKNELSGFVTELKQSNIIKRLSTQFSSDFIQLTRYWNFPENKPLIIFPVGDKKLIGFIVCIPKTNSDAPDLPVEILTETISILHQAHESRKKQSTASRIEPIFEKLSETVFEGIAVTEKGLIRYVNNRFSEMFGYEESEFLGKPILNFITKEDKKFVKDKINNEQEDTYEVTCVRKDGQYFPVEACGKTVEYQGRRLRLSVVRDTSKDRSMAEFLHDRELQFQNLFTFTNDAIFIIDPETQQILDTNEKAHELLGYDGAEYSQLHLFELDSQADKQAMDIMIKNMISKENYIYENKFARKDGSVIAVEINARLVEQSSQKIIICFVRDVTSRKKMESELARAQRLEAAGQVAGQIAHDFNNLLGPLAAYPPIIRSELPDEHTAHGMLDEMEFSANKIAEINQQLLTLGRRGHYRKELINLNDILQKVILQLPQENFTLNQELTKDLFLIEGGAAQLMRILMNLITNSKEAIPTGGVITIKTENVYLEKPPSRQKRVNKGQYVKVEISDNGSGISSKNIEKIFDPFFTTKRMDKQRGTGLGLSIVHSIIDDHNGYISVESEVDVGTAFSLYFPVSNKLNVEKVIPHLKGGHEKILIVDDDPLQRQVSSELLRRMGYKVSCVDSGQEAIDFIKRKPQDLVLMDMLMAGLNGAETYGKILEIYPNQKAIIITGYAMTLQIREALDLGAGAYLTKPVTMLALGTAIRKELDRKQR